MISEYKYYKPSLPYKMSMPTPPISYSIRIIWVTVCILQSLWTFTNHNPHETVECFPSSYVIWTLVNNTFHRPFVTLHILLNNNIFLLNTNSQTVMWKRFGYLLVTSVTTMVFDDTMNIGGLDRASTAVVSILRWTSAFTL